MARQFSGFFLLFLGACSGEAFQPSDPNPTQTGTAGAGSTTGTGGASAEAGKGGEAGTSDPSQNGGTGGTGGTVESAGTSGAASAGENAGGNPGAGGSSGQGGANPGGSPQGEGGKGGEGDQAGQAGAGGDACEPGAFVCDGERLLQCKGSPAALVPLLDCPGELCDAQQGKCLACVPGTPLGCKDEYTQVVCSEKGTTDGLQPCTEATPFCDAASQGACRGCLKDDQCDVPTTWWCGTPVCKNYQCVEGVKVGTTYIDFDFGGDCSKPICAEDENGGPAIDVIEDPLDQPINDPDGCDVRSCDGAKLIIEKKTVGTPCKQEDGDDGVCDDNNTCQRCLLGETRCEGNSIAVCEEGSWKQNYISFYHCHGDTPACVEAQCTGINAIALGDAHSCVLLDTGHVQCWGDNKYAQVGTSLDTLKVTRPILLPGVTGIKQLALGARHTCALDQAGKVSCWGDNARGQLGSPSNGQTPAVVEGLPPVSFLAAGGATTCAITSDKKLFCWGDGEFGQTFVSAGASKSLLVPTQVPGAPVFSKVALGQRHGCGLTPDGSVHCWGDTVYSSTTPPNTKVSLSGSFSELDVGNLHTCVRGSGGFFCWGAPGPQLGSIFPQGQFTVVDLLASTGKQLALGAAASCQLTKAEGSSLDQVQCAGKNDRGQLGGSPADPSKPSVRLLLGATKLAVGGNHACATALAYPSQPSDSTPALYCWGANESGQIGNGTLDDALTPQKTF